MNLTKEKHALQIVINEAEISALGDNDKVVLKAVEITKANARLIAAAPELLAQCKLFEKVLTYYYGTDKNTAISATANENRDKCREVLAKVEGGEG